MCTVAVREAKLHLPHLVGLSLKKKKKKKKKKLASMQMQMQMQRVCRIVSTNTEDG
jgi:hypothetical protein